MSTWNFECPADATSAYPQLNLSQHSIDKIDSRLFQAHHDSPNLNRFFSQASGSNKLENIKISRIKGKMNKICENMVSLAKEAFSFLEEGNTLRVLRKKNEFKPDFLRGVWKNYKKFLTRSVKAVQKVFEDEKEFNAVLFTEKYLETCMLNFKFFFVHLYEMATKFYAKKRTNQVSWISQNPSLARRKRKFSFEDPNLQLRCGRKGQLGSLQRVVEASADLSKSSVTSHSMSPEMVKNKMEKMLSKILSRHSLKVSLNSSRDSPNWTQQIHGPGTPEQGLARERSHSSVLKDVCDGLEAIHYSQNNTNNFVIANCEDLQRGQGLSAEDKGSRKRGSYSRIFEEEDSAGEDDLQSMQNFLIETTDNFIATRKPSWLDKDKPDVAPSKLLIGIGGENESKMDRKDKSREMKMNAKGAGLRKITRKKWTSQEDEHLLKFLKSTFPKKISSEQIVALGFKLNRTKSSISNRLKILKKNHKPELERITEEMVDSALPKTRPSLRQTCSSRKKSRTSKLQMESPTWRTQNISDSNPNVTIGSDSLTKQQSIEKSRSSERYCLILKTFKTIQPLLDEQERSLIEIQNFLRVDTEAQFAWLVDHLQELRTMCKIRSREAVFIRMREVVIKTLQQKKENFWPEGGYSAILDFVFTSFYHQDFGQMCLRDIKEKVVGQFNFDMNIDSFDEQFVQFLQHSQYFLISRKEVYFI